MRYVKLLRLALPQTKAEMICDGIGIAGLIGIFIAGQIGLLP